MNWENLLNPERLEQRHKDSLNSFDCRTQFQRDYDRIIFSSCFRRMQNKTQVFPLPGTIYVHNRLTHSIEVSGVGRSLGNRITRYLAQNLNIQSPYISAIGTIVATGCLAHDIGNPPFGHAGESAIAEYFKEGNGRKYQSYMNEKEWNDFVFFDGNPNTLRILCHQFRGKRKGGFALTYTTLASILKYPYSSEKISRPKFGYFQSEKEIFDQIISQNKLSNKSVNHGASRHPLVYLVEAADDICYQIMDIEDAFKLNILDYDTASKLFIPIIASSNNNLILKEIDKTFHEVTDRNEQISVLRSMAIGTLVENCEKAFIENYSQIMSGTFQGSLIQSVPSNLSKALNYINKISNDEVYKDKRVIEIVLAGYRILDTLLDEFCSAVISPKKEWSDKLLSLIPSQYHVDINASEYIKIQSIVDFVSSMTDIYALDLYRKIKGISLPNIVG